MSKRSHWLFALLTIGPLAQAEAVKTITKPSPVDECLGLPTMEAWHECQDRKEAVMLGKYFCVITRIAGLQDVNGQRSVFSRISDTESKFFMEIVKDDTLPCSSLGSNFLYLKDDVCRTKYKMNAKSDLVASPAYAPFVPWDFVAPRGTFSITKDGNFWANYRFDAHYVYEGKCEKIN